MRGHFKFIKYDAEELKQAGAAVLDLLHRGYSPEVHEPPTEAWTELILDWFAHTAGTFAGKPVLADARPREARLDWRPHFTNLSGIPMRATRGEFVLDLAHSTYPEYRDRYYTHEYWDEVLREDREILLGLEAEWGKYGDPQNTRVKVLEEAVKLAAVRARVKILVLGANGAEQQQQLFADIALLRYRARDTSPWLLVGVPWKLKDARWSPEYQVLDKTARP